ncbi:hypothetical protein ACH5RR_026730 [Cinchona calisaya]|uniref:Uncharacterized protein n=1 Tax=Cinchona calisaya TaxID=153742 RepID=A0ABD2Z4G2_9GENT
MQKATCGGIVVLYGDSKVQKWNLLRILYRTMVPDICSLLYSYTSDIDMDSRDIDYPSEVVVYGDLPPCGRNNLTEQVLRYLLLVRRPNLTEQVDMFRRNRQHGHLVYGSILKYKNLRVLDLGKCSSPK